MNFKKNIDKLISGNKNIFKNIIRSKKIHKLDYVDYFNLFTEVHKNSTPCFVLSTGRCGTHLLTKLLSEHKKIDVYHTPFPELVYYSKYAYENNNKKDGELRRIVDAARYDYVRDSYLLGNRFVETNNRITFFADQLADLYPKSKFIHLVRHPIEFVRSGLNRQWYSGRNEHDEGRIVLNKEEWNQFSNIKKIAWLWEATNRYIENFKAKIGSERMLTILSEELFSDFNKGASIFAHLNLEPIKYSSIKKIVGKPTNVGKKKIKDKFNDNEITEIYQVTELRKKYGYE